MNDTGIRSYTIRSSHATPSQARAYQNTLPRYSIPISSSPIDLRSFFPHAPYRRNLIAEIGSGMGDATIELAVNRPNLAIVAIEVHIPGLGKLARLAEKQNIENIRVIQYDAISVFKMMIASQTLDGIHIFFPDPWPKKRHRKRRLLQKEFLFASHPSYSRRRVLLYCHRLAGLRRTNSGNR